MGFVPPEKISLGGPACLFRHSAAMFLTLLSD